MPRSKTVARNRTFPAINPEWPAARKAQLRRSVLQKMAKLRRSMAATAEVAGETAGAPPSDPRGDPRSGPASREGSCGAAANTPSMPR